MKQYTEMTREERRAAYAAARKEYEACQAMDLHLNMARGKPGSEQLDLVTEMHTLLQKPEDFISEGIDTRNYGEIAGLPEARRLFAELLGCRSEECLVGGNASLQLMYAVVGEGFIRGLRGGTPWHKLDKVKWLCPVPGYDRHFKISRHFGMELLSVPMTEEGPDMDVVEELIRDEAVKGMWNVPKYSNPEGVVYSDETVRRLAAMRPAAGDFALMWDNAYCLHDLSHAFRPFPDIIGLCREAGNPDMVYEFASTSKVTFPGAGVSVMAASEANIRALSQSLNIQTICYDKVNQLRHVRFLRSKEHTLELMQRHAAILRPKFRAVLDALEREIAPLGIGQWREPEGGYFISYNAMPGTARRTLELCAGAGVTMTGAGAAFPYGVDPEDSNIRIAPTLPPVAELEQAIAVLCTCLKMSALEKLGI
jgi:DNA-binding transcriptional MocR family regulator